MISFKHVKRFCCDDLSLIENYDEAMNDNTQVWDCHHKLEIELNLSRAELIEKDLYDNRPASELIFLTHEEHQRIHKTYQNPMTGKTGILCPNYGRSQSGETKEILSIKAQKQWSDPKAREIQQSRRHMNNGINRVFPTPEEFEYYKSKGYHFGLS